MSNSRKKFLLVAAIAALVVSYLGFAYLRRAQPSFNEAVAFVRSVYKLVEAYTQRGSPLPSSVSVRELVDGGYITPKMARRFAGAQVVLPHLPTQPQLLESAPQQVLISLRLPDGRETVMTADGSIHQIPR